MLAIRFDEEVDSLSPFEDPESFATLLSCMTGRKIDISDNSFAQRQINSFLDKVKANGGPENLNIELAQLNELLLLLGQRRVSRAFFGFFFSLESGFDDADVSELSKSQIKIIQVVSGVKRFRGYAMLCYGSFLTAFTSLSEIQSLSQLCGELRWTSSRKFRLGQYLSRCQSINPITGGNDDIPREETWFTGYLSSRKLQRDKETLCILEKKANEFEAQMKASGEEPPGEVKNERERVIKLRSSYDKIIRRQEATLQSAQRNSLCYLTWDYLDVYVATSMREKWEFEATHDFLRKVIHENLSSLSKESLRWFDPTQCVLEYPSDKGLLEALMLKRASCTLYMAQESDTLGKDSELAATLAQGKPVIAYVPQIAQAMLTDYCEKLKLRPLEYIRKRLFSLLAEGFFDKSDTIHKIAQFVSKEMVWGIEEIVPAVTELLDVVREFCERRRQFLVIEPEEESRFRLEHEEIFSKGLLLLAAIEAIAFDARADTIQLYHPLNMQVHLEKGVSNGVLVVRSEEECGALLENLLLEDVKFDIETEPNPQTGDPAATVLKEIVSGSKFRIVTKNDALTHSFWMFYN